jgi:hypothetical protein
MKYNIKNTKSVESETCAIWKLVIWILYDTPNFV